MTRHLHIVNRAGVFYWRRRLSGELARAFGRSQIRISLRTRDPSIVRRIGQILSVHFDQFLYQMQLEHRVPTADEQRLILTQLHQLILDECKDERLRNYPEDEIPDEHKFSSPEDLSEPVPPEERDRQAFFHDPKLSADMMRSHRAENRFGPIRYLLRPILAARNIDADTDLLAFRKFLDLALQFAVHAFDAADAEWNRSNGPMDFEELMAKLPPSAGEPDSTARRIERSAPRSSAAPRNINSDVASLPISAFIEGFLKDDEEHVSGGTHKQKRAALKLLVRIVGDIPADSITRKDVQKLDETLQKMPSSYGKSPKDEATPIAEVIEGAVIGKGTMTLSTLVRHWRNINAFYRYVNRQDEVSPIDMNRVFEEFRWSPKVPQGEDRQAWSDEMDFGRLSAARAADGVVEGPPFAPAAERWALM